jgi:hypothetical protein
VPAWGWGGGVGAEVFCSGEVKVPVFFFFLYKAFLVLYAITI